MHYSKFQELRMAFRMFDRNKDGYVDAKEIKELTTTLGQRLTFDELVVIQFTVVIYICFLPKLHEFLVRQFLAQSRRDSFELFGLDVSITVFVENLKGFFQSLWV